MTTYGAQQPNWFDNEFSEKLENATAEQSLAEIARNPRVVQAVREAIAEHDAHSKKPGWCGPTRTQVIRKTVAEALLAEA